MVHREMLPLGLRADSPGIFPIAVDGGPCLAHQTPQASRFDQDACGY